MGSLVDTNSIFSHDSLQTNIPGSAISIGSARTRRSSLRSKRGHFLSPTSEWHVLCWIEFKSLIICPHEQLSPNMQALAWKKEKGNFQMHLSKSIVKNQSLLPTLLRISCIFGYFTVCSCIKKARQMLLVSLWWCLPLPLHTFPKSKVHFSFDAKAKSFKIYSIW